MRHLLFALFIGFFLTTGSVLFGQTPEPAKAILILDASGSMWGKVEERAKIEIAREAVRDILSQWDPSLHLGLMVYGHRSKGDCKDIELLIPPGPVDKEAFYKAVDGLTPKGKTPLTDAVLQAAQALRSSEEKATVILVSDGLETCGKDPCAAARQLEKEGFDFTAHVIGFDLKAEEQKSIRCLADTTGGLFVAADDAASLKSALESVVKKTVEPTPTPEATPEPTATPAPEPEFTTATVQFKTVLTEGGEEVESYFEIRKPGEKEVLAKGSTGKFPLEPGTYEVSAKWGQAQITQSIEIPQEADVERVLTYEAGLLHLKAKVANESEEAKAYFNIYKAEAAPNGKRERVTYGSHQEFKLPAGRYVVEATWGNATVSRDVEIKPGEVTDETLILEAGLLHLASTLGESETADGAYYTIFSGKTKMDGSRERITYGSQKEYKLPVGTYRVEAKWGQAIGVADVEIKGGERTEITISIPGGLLAVKAQDTSGAEVKPYITVNRLVSELSGKYEQVHGATTDQFKLEAGKYRISAKIGDQTVTAEAEIKTGERTDVIRKPSED